MWQSCWCASVVSRTLGVCLRRLARSPQLAVDLVGVLLEQFGRVTLFRDTSHIPARRAGRPVGVFQGSQDVSVVHLGLAVRITAYLGGP